MDVPEYVPLAINPRRYTDARPGSEEKIAILRARAEAGIPLHNRRDAKLETMPGDMISSGNGRMLGDLPSLIGLSD
jgi:hypothetical protein